MQNYRNQEVVDEMKDVLRFWLRKGVDGFRIDAVPFIFESEENDEGYYDDEPKSGICDDDPEASCSLNHTETKDLDETYGMIYQWRKVVDEEEFANLTKLVLFGFIDLILEFRTIANWEKPFFLLFISFCPSIHVYFHSNFI